MPSSREDILSDIESKKWWLEQAEKSDRDIRAAYSQGGLPGWGSDNNAAKDAKKYRKELEKLYEELEELELTPQERAERERKEREERIAEFKRIEEEEWKKEEKRREKERQKQAELEKKREEYPDLVKRFNQYQPKKARTADDFENIKREYSWINRQFEAMGDYENAPDYAVKSNEKYGKALSEENKFEAKARAKTKIKKNMLIVFGILLQTGVLAIYLYILLGTTIVQESFINTESGNLTDIVIWGMPLILYALTIGFISILFLYQKIRLNYLFYIVGIIAHAIMPFIWENALRNKFTLENLFMELICVIIFVIPGAILGLHNARKFKIISVFVIISTVMVMRYGISNDWFYDKEDNTAVTLAGSCVTQNANVKLNLQSYIKI